MGGIIDLTYGARLALYPGISVDSTSQLLYKELELI